MRQARVLAWCLSVIARSGNLALCLLEHLHQLATGDQVLVVDDDFGHGVATVVQCGMVMSAPRILLRRNGSLVWMLNMCTATTGQVRMSSALVTIIGFRWCLLT